VVITAECIDVSQLWGRGTPRLPPKSMPIIGSNDAVTQ